MDVASTQQVIFANKVAKGFDTTDVPLEFCLLQGEIAEAFEAWHRGADTLGEELADVAIYLLGLSEILNVDLETEIERKIAKNARREYARSEGGAYMRVSEGE
jgi:NTP pyrophosphatase (non-canonical NTP hydrolase)